MKAPKSILVPTDFSEGSLGAAQYAVALASELRGGATVHLVHALATPAGLPVGLLPGPALVAPPAEEGPSKDVAANELADFHRRVQAPAGVEVTTDLWPGPAKATLAKRASDYDLVVMGTHGRTGLLRLALGSVAEHLVRKAPVPVLTVGGRAVASDAAVAGTNGAAAKDQLDPASAAGGDLTALRSVGDVMTRNPLTLSPNVRVRGAAQFAERLRFCHVLVENPDDGALLGVACTCGLCHEGGDKKLGEVMSSPAITVTPETTLEEAAEIMKTKEIGALPVLDSGDLVGIITTTDLQARGLAEGLGLATGKCDSCGGQIHVRLHSAESAAEFCADCMEQAHPVEGHDMIGVGD